MDLWANCRSKFMERGLNASDTEGEKPLGVVRRMGSMGRKRVEPLRLSSPSKTPMKKPYVVRVNSERSILEVLPEDILVRIICGVEHEDLDRLLHVSSTVRDATIIAKKWHFEFRTPSSKSANLRSFSDMDDEDVPNAPKQRKSHRSRISRRRLADITVALFHSSEEE